ncbi:MAG: hypothetical protein WBC90_11615, partial [Albidovulum sp.]
IAQEALCSVRVEDAQEVFGRGLGERHRAVHDGKAVIGQGPILRAILPSLRKEVLEVLKDVLSDFCVPHTVDRCSYRGRLSSTDKHAGEALGHLRQSGAKGNLDIGCLAGRVKVPGQWPAEVENAVP